MSAREEILQACRAWIQASADVSATLTGAQVVPANDKGPRPDLPYITVLVTLADMVEGRDEPRQTFADTLTVIAAGSTGSVFTVTIDDEAITYTRIAGETTTTIATALAAAIRAAQPETHARSAAAVITICGMWEPVEVSTADAKLALVADALAVAGVAGERSGRVSVQGFGLRSDPGTVEGWLERIAIALRDPEIDDALSVAGLSVFASGGMTDIAQLLDSAIEPRYLREFSVTYRIRIEPAAFDFAILASLAATDETGTEFTDTVEIDLEP